MEISKKQSRPNIPTIDKCVSIGRDKDTVVADMDGTLLRGRSSFPYFALVAFEVGGVLRLLFLLMVLPLIGFFYYLVSEAAGIHLLIFATFAGMKVSDIETTARAVLPKFYSEDIHPETWRVFSSCGNRYVLTANPRILVEPFLKEYLGSDMVIGTEIHTYKGRATGLVLSPGILVGKNKANALLKAVNGSSLPEIGLGDRETDYEFMKLCKESYLVPTTLNVAALSHHKLPKPVIFHDGRLVAKPTPFMALLIVLWIPIGFLLACIRVFISGLLPMSIAYHAIWLLGVRIYIKGKPPRENQKTTGQSHVLFVCSHRTLLDAVLLSAALGRKIPVVSYSISRFTEIISPIKTVRLTRDRVTDAKIIASVLQQDDLVICPEGTTCRERFLLRFSSLFAELTDDLVPVAISTSTNMFHGTTAGGRKWMDSFFFFMNPSPVYRITILNKLPQELTRAGGKTSHEVANYVQSVIAKSLSYECTNFTRRDKYRALTRTDGTVVDKPKLVAIS